MKRLLIALVLGCALSGNVHGQWKEPQAAPNEITVTAPTFAIPAGPSVKLPVTGLLDDELANTAVNVDPKLGVTLEQTLGWDKKPQLMFGALYAGKYTITVVLHPENSWRLSSTQALLAARDPKMDSELLAEYDTFATAFSKKLVEKYPYKFGTCVVEVAGTVPFPSPNPQPNPNPQPSPNPGPIQPNTKLRVTYVFEKDQNNTPRPVAAALNKLNAEPGGLVVATEFEQNSDDGTGDTPEQYKIALKAAREAGLPALIVQSGATVLRVIKNPQTEQSVMDAVK